MEDIYRNALIGVMAASFALVKCTTELTLNGGTADQYRALINVFAVKVKEATATVSELEQE